MRTVEQCAAPPAAMEYAAKVRKCLGAHARQVILFGSQARGDATVASDYDFVIVVDKRSRELREMIGDVGADLLNESEALCAAMIYDGEQWEKVRQSPLGWNVEREGVLL
jgi:predicted nucleotidyltransferase